jgi:hypothetical protein
VPFPAAGGLKGEKAVKGVTQVIPLPSVGGRGTITFTTFAGFRVDDRENCREGA